MLNRIFSAFINKSNSMLALMIISLLCYLPWAKANTVNDTSINVISKHDIESLAESYALSVYPNDSEEKIIARASKIDSRLTIQPCDSELTPTTPNINIYSRHLTVKIKCDGKKPWSLYIPVQVKIMAPVLIASQHLKQGEILSNSNVEIVMVEKHRLRKGVLADTSGISGAKTKKQIRSGEAIINKNICFVCKGDAVNLVANVSSLSVKTTGIALSDGSFGETIQVKNKNSGRIVQGRVSSAGQIEVNL